MHDVFKRAFALDNGAMAIFDRRQPLISSAFWRDNRDRAALVRASDCVSLRALDRFLAEMHAVRPQAARDASLSDPDDVLDESAIRTEDVCQAVEVDQ